MTKPIIEVKNLTKHFDNKIILEDISFDVHENESLVILGKSGTGKSVLFKCILGLLPLTSGKVTINGKSTKCLSEHKRFSITQSISMVFQGSALFDSNTIMENIVFGLKYKKELSKLEQIKIATEALEKVNLDSSILNLYPTEISGGMQKRVAFARAITSKPKVIFFDEPTTGLDPISSTVISNLISTISKDLGIVAITITHDIISAKSIASNVILLNESKIAWKGTIEEFNKTDNKLVYNFANGIPS